MWHDIANPLLTCVGVVLAAIVGGWFGHLTAKKNAETNNQDAFTRAYQAASDNWARYTEAMQKWCEHQADELGHLSTRLTNAEIALEAERLARYKAESLYSVALIYLRRIASWVTEHWPGETLPPPPPQLEADL